MTQRHHYIGLSDAEVLKSRELHGSNVLTPPEKESVWKKFLAKFKEPLIIILLIAGALSISISCYEFFFEDAGGRAFFEPVGIFVAIFLATGLAFLFELKAEREFSLLNQVSDEDPIQVIRNGFFIEIPKKDVVVGDIVKIECGNEVPADGTLLEAVSLTLDESTLTGEPVCSKTVVEEDFDDEATFPSNCVLRGTTVMEGHGLFKVNAVGDHTENGHVFTAAQIENTFKTPLDEQLNRLSRVITWGSYIVAFLIVVGRTFLFLHTETFDWSNFIGYFFETIMIAVTLIVVSVPEGLPMAVTLSLAYSMRRMLKSNNLVRRLHSCETMGAATVICTDKTGTLTRNQMRIYDADFFTLKSHSLGSDEMSSIIKESIAVNSTASLDVTDDSNPKVLGNPTEGALLLWLHDAGINYRQLVETTEIIEQIPFSTERKFMATLAYSPVLGKRILYVKGAPEIIYSYCHGTCCDVPENDIKAKLLDYQSKAMRTLGFAYQFVADGQNVISGDNLVADNLTFLGIVAISDPVREDVPAAVKECLDAGIKVKIVTGDTIGTAQEIGRQIGLWSDSDNDRNIITGPQFAELSDDELLNRVLDLKIISRARPMDKKRLVEALRQKGEVVAVTGDGTNDAPALKAAHVGLSMGDGTAVAKEASDITILDNSFSSITQAVMWGRSLYKNIQRFIMFQMTVNVVACLIVLFGAFMGTDSPLTVTQMLWVNLIMDTLAATALAALPPTKRVMHDKPRSRKDFIISKKMAWNIFGVGGAFFLFLFALLIVFENYDIRNMAQIINLPILDALRPKLSIFELSIFFTIFVMLQFWNMFNARAFDSGKSAFNLRGCQSFLGIIALIFVGQILIICVGGNLFNVTPFPFIDWVIIVAGTSVVLFIGEIFRFVHHHFLKD
jgi:Ca2+-transporting ATPase